MDNIIEQIRSQTDDFLSENEDLFLVDIIKKGNTASVAKVIVLLDGDNGVSIEKCAELSRKVSRYIDETIELDQPLTVEVSSAGVDHPLKMQRQYEKNIERNIKVSLNDGSVIEGKLKSIEDDLITLEKLRSKKQKVAEIIQLNLSEINKTIVLVSFK